MSLNRQLPSPLPFLQPCLRHFLEALHWTPIRPCLYRLHKNNRKCADRQSIRAQDTPVAALGVLCAIVLSKKQSAAAALVLPQLLRLMDIARCSRHQGPMPLATGNRQKSAQNSEEAREKEEKRIKSAVWHLYATASQVCTQFGTAQQEAIDEESVMAFLTAASEEETSATVQMWSETLSPQLAYTLHGHATEPPPPPPPLPLLSPQYPDTNDRDCVDDSTLFDFELYEHS